MEVLPAPRGIWVIGDTHHGRADSHAGSSTDYANAVKYDLARIGHGDGIFHVGDLADHGLTAEHATAAAWMTAIGINNAVIGNHDMHSTLDGDAAYAAWGLGASRNWTVDLGYALLVGVSPLNAGAGDQPTLDSIALTYLTTAIDNATKDVWVLFHAPLTSNSTVQSMWPDAYIMLPSATIMTQLARTRVKAVISGHVHRSPFIIRDQVCAYDMGGGHTIAHICLPATTYNQHYSPNTQADVNAGELYGCHIYYIAPGGAPNTIEVRLRNVLGRYWVPWLPEKKLVRTIDLTSTPSTPIPPTGLTYQATVLADLPVGYWKLDETSGTSATDSSGNGLTGTYNNAPTFNVTPGIAEGKAVTFAGASVQTMTVADNALLHVNDTFSYEFWCKRAATGIAHDVFGQNTAGSLLIRINATNTISMRLFGTGDVVASTGTLDTNWHHVVLAKDGATDASIYIDGVERSGTVTNGTFTTAATAHTWAGNGGGTNVYNGALDELAIYNYALSLDQVTAHYAARNT